MDRVAVFVDAGYLFAQGSTHIHATNQRPPEIDGRLLTISRNALGGNALDSKQKYEVRTAFLDALVERLGRDNGKAAE